MSQPSVEAFSKLLAYLYDGHIEEDPYNTFLHEMRQSIDANFGSITMREPEGDDGGLLIGVDLQKDPAINFCKRPRKSLYRSVLHVEFDDQPAMGRDYFARRVRALLVSRTD